MDYKALGMRIRHFRLAHGWTQEILAESANISVSFLGHIERGSRKASLETLVSIMNALQVSADSLLCDSLRVSSTEFPVFLNSQQRTVLQEVIRALDATNDAWGR